MIVTSFFVNKFVEGLKMQTWKISQTSDLIISILKVFSTKMLGMIWSIVVAIF